MMQRLYLTTLIFSFLSSINIALAAEETQKFVSLQNTADDWLTLNQAIIKQDNATINEKWQILTEYNKNSLFLMEQAFNNAVRYASFEEMLEYSKQKLHLIESDPALLKQNQNFDKLHYLIQALQYIKHNKDEKEILKLVSYGDFNDPFDFIQQAVFFRFGNNKNQQAAIKKFSKDFPILTTYFTLEYAYMQQDAKALIKTLKKNPNLYIILNANHIRNYVELLAAKKMEKQAVDLQFAWTNAAPLRNMISIKESKALADGNKQHLLANDLSVIAHIFSLQKANELTAITLNFAGLVDVQSPTIAHQKGLFHVSINNAPYGLKFLEKAVIDDSTRNKALYDKAVILTSQKQYKQASDIMKYLYNKYPAQLEFVDLYSNLYRLRQQYDSCTKYSTETLNIAHQKQINPQGFAKLYFQRGVCFERQDLWDKAEADLKKAVELSPDNPTMLNYLAYSWANMGINLEEAETMLLHAIERFPNNGNIIDSLGWVYFRQNRLPEALAELNKAANLAPSQGEIFSHLGDVLWYLGRRQEARYAWQRVLDFKSSEEELKQRALYKKTFNKPIQIPGEKQTQLDILEIKSALEEIKTNAPANQASQS